jgi:hypothetical protein
MLTHAMCRTAMLLANPVVCAAIVLVMHYFCIPGSHTIVDTLVLVQGGKRGH